MAALIRLPLQLGGTVFAYVCLAERTAFASCCLYTAMASRLAVGLPRVLHIHERALLRLIMLYEPTSGSCVSVGGDGNVERLVKRRVVSASPLLPDFRLREICTPGAVRWTQEAFVRLCRSPPARTVQRLELHNSQDIHDLSPIQHLSRLSELHLTTEKPTCDVRGQRLPDSLTSLTTNSFRLTESRHLPMSMRSLCVNYGGWTPRDFVRPNDTMETMRAKLPPGANDLVSLPLTSLDLGYIGVLTEPFLILLAREMPTLTNLRCFGSVCPLVATPPFTNLRHLSVHLESPPSFDYVRTSTSVAKAGAYHHDTYEIRKSLLAIGGIASLTSLDLRQSRIGALECLRALLDPEQYGGRSVLALTTLDLANCGVTNESVRFLTSDNPRSTARNCDLWRHSLRKLILSCNSELSDTSSLRILTCLDTLETLYCANITSTIDANGAPATTV
jgi:hypothetical protein